MRNHWAPWAHADKNGLEEESAGAPVKLPLCPSSHTIEGQAKVPQFPFLLLWQGEAETGILSTEEKVSIRSCQAVMPNHQHLKYSSAFQTVHFKCKTCSFLSCHLTLRLYFPAHSKPRASAPSFHFMSANDRYNSNKRELVLLFVL